MRSASSCRRSRTGGWRRFDVHSRGEGRREVGEGGRSRESRGRAGDPRSGAETSSVSSGEPLPFRDGPFGTSGNLGFIWGDPSSYMDEPPSFWGDPSSLWGEGSSQKDEASSEKDGGSSIQYEGLSYINPGSPQKVRAFPDLYPSPQRSKGCVLLNAYPPERSAVSSEKERRKLAVPDCLNLSKPISYAQCTMCHRAELEVRA
jgi:hypothetical protein